LNARIIGNKIKVNDFGVRLVTGEKATFKNNEYYTNENYCVLSEYAEIISENNEYYSHRCFQARDIKGNVILNNEKFISSDGKAGIYILRTDNVFIHKPFFSSEFTTPYKFNDVNNTKIDSTNYN